MEDRYAKIVRMKMVWVYLMVSSFAAFLGTLVPTLFRYDSNGVDWLVEVLGGLSVVFLIVSVLAFIKAAKLGKEEDRINEPLGNKRWGR